MVPYETFDYEDEHRCAEHEHEGRMWKTGKLPPKRDEAFRIAKPMRKAS
mgnify:CR=1 FL=1